MTIETSLVAEPPKLTRRLLLGGVGGAVVSLGLPASWAVAAPSGYELRDLGPAGSVPLSGDQSLPIPRVLGAEAAAVSGTLPSGTIMEFRFDEGLYDRLETPLVLAAGSPLKYTIMRDTREAVSLRLDQDAPSGAPVSVVVGVQRPRHFPSDACRAGWQPKGELRTPRNALATRPHHKAQAREAWGVTVDVGWQEISWGEHHRTFVPTTALLTSVGPAATPRSLDLVIRTDQRVRPKVSASSTSARVRVGRPKDVGGGVLWQLAGSLEAGESAMVRLSGEIITPSGDLPGLVTPSVTVGGGAASRGQRVTMRETSIRNDSIFDAESWEALRTR